MNRPIRSRRSADEGGSVLPLVALILVVLMTCAALATDLGLQAATNRRLQGVADLAAIAGSAKLTGAACNASAAVFDDVRIAALANAATNAFPLGGTKSLLIEVGTLAYVSGQPAGSRSFTSLYSTASTGGCTSSSVPTAVRVTARDFTTFSFGSAIGRDGKSTERRGVAEMKSDRFGGFMIGSSVANFDLSKSAVLNSVLTGMICSAPSCTIATSLVGYNGLATAGVTLGALQTQLGMGSVTQLLNTSISYQEFYLATATLLGCTAAVSCPGNAAAVALLNMRGEVNSSIRFVLGDLIDVATGSEAAAASTRLNVLSLVTGSAQLLNGSNFVSVPSIGITIPGVASTSMSIRVIEQPQTYIGPVGGGVSTSQVEVTVTPTLNMDVGVLKVTGTLPVKVVAGSATGTLTQVTCAPTPGEIVTVNSAAAAVTIGSFATSSALLSVGTTIIVPIALATINASAGKSVGGVNGSQLAFSYPSQYLPTSTTPRHVGGTALNLQGTGLNTSVNVINGIVSVDASVVTAPLIAPGGLLSVIDTTVLTPLLEALGLDIGGADVWAIGAPTCPRGFSRTAG